jgi:acyl-CoA dehydrogenase
MSLPNFPSPWMTEEHHTLQDSVARFFKERWVPQTPAWREAGSMPRETWNEAGAQGLLCLSTPAEYGGGGGDFGHDAVVILEASRANLSGYGGGLHSAIVAPYLIHCGTEEQKRRFLPRMVTGELVSAIAMTEPGTGSDLQGVRTWARRDGDDYVLNGAKTFITNGQNANLVVVVCKTDRESAAKGISLLLVETCSAASKARASSS